MLTCSNTFITSVPTMRPENIFAKAAIFIVIFATSGFWHRSDAYSHSIQCYACGLSKIPNDSELRNSYPRYKTFNHSCDEMMNTAENGKISTKFIRNCPVNSSGCFSATGHYDRGDRNPYNDIRVTFLGCSEAGRTGKSGCEKGKDQSVQIKDSGNKSTQMSIDVKICFCKHKLCNDPRMKMMTIFPNSSSNISAQFSFRILISVSYIMQSIFHATS